MQGSHRFLNRLATGLMLAMGGLALAGCASTSSLDQLAGATPTGSAFTQQLFRNYAFLANSFGSAGSSDFDSDGVLTVFDGGGDTDALAEAFATKALIAARGSEPEPEPSIDGDSATARERLIGALGQSKDRFPVDAARAQTDFDCWMLNSAVDSQASAAAQCRMSFDRSIARLEHDSRPVMAPPAPAAAPPTDYTVYFDFNSWTLSGEQLGVLQKAIATARAGGQSRITVVGHTDTSGAANYNQKLSVKRANVVTETLVDMGARREAIQVSGVGENDLAVPTADGVREPKNRRTVVTLFP
jgi:outer membrane protein OmpA-like peptidoglycan-associated protein/outer membrane murein-binding lipoprotein Lpp